MSVWLDLYTLQKCYYDLLNSFGCIELVVSSLFEIVMLSKLLFFVQWSKQQPYRWKCTIKFASFLGDIVSNLAIFCKIDALIFVYLLPFVSGSSTLELYTSKNMIDFTMPVFFQVIIWLKVSQALYRLWPVLLHCKLLLFYWSGYCLQVAVFYLLRIFCFTGN